MLIVNGDCGLEMIIIKDLEIITDKKKQNREVLNSWDIVV